MHIGHNAAQLNKNITQTLKQVYQTSRVMFSAGGEVRVPKRCLRRQEFETRKSPLGKVGRKIQHKRFKQSRFKQEYKKFKFKYLASSRVKSIYIARHDSEPAAFDHTHRCAISQPFTAERGDYTKTYM